MHHSTDHFSANGRIIDDLTLSDCWTWAYSDLTDSMNRSILAEYIVATALNIANSSKRKPSRLHNSWSFSSSDGYRISVESASFIQSCDAEHPDHITFRNVSASNCDVCIFCVHKSLSEDDSPLDLDTWDFYVIRSGVLLEKTQEQKTLTLPSLMRSEPLWCDYYGIEEAVRETMNV